jgi:hypothetical protein
VEQRGNSSRAHSHGDSRCARLNPCVDRSPKERSSHGLSLSANACKYMHNPASYHIQYFEMMWWSRAGALNITRKTQTGVAANDDCVLPPAPKYSAMVFGMGGVAPQIDPAMYAVGCRGCPSSAALQLRYTCIMCCAVPANGGFEGVSYGEAS